jgi:hypothetical protein
MTPIKEVRRESVTVSGRDILAKVEASKPKENKIVSGGVVVDGLASPILVKKSSAPVDGAVIEESTVETGVEEMGKATGLGIDEGAVEGSS